MLSEAYIPDPRHLGNRHAHAGAYAECLQPWSASWRFVSASWWELRWPEYDDASAANTGCFQFFQYCDISRWSEFAPGGSDIDDRQ